MASASPPLEGSPSERVPPAVMHSDNSNHLQSRQLNASPNTTRSPRAPSECDPTSPTTKLMLNGAGKIYRISPAAALEFLCENVNRLANPDGNATPTSINSSASGSDSPARRNSEASASDSLAEFHFAHSADDEGHWTRRDSIQQGILAKRFLSKREPPISLKDYLLRLHKYCPMSTAVYLATSIYITKIVSVERILPVHSRNMHRLVLAGLRVATKALEDLSYPHSRFAKVGGVSERELSRLEISFCFLINFELRVDAPMLYHQTSSLQAGVDSALHLGAVGLPTPTSSPAQNNTLPDS